MKEKKMKIKGTVTLNVPKAFVDVAREAQRNKKLEKFFVDLLNKANPEFEAELSSFVHEHE